jgi:hypothetical protein
MQVAPAAAATAASDLTSNCQPRALACCVSEGGSCTVSIGRCRPTRSWHGGQPMCHRLVRWQAYAAPC